jgi:hypothetical protein
VSQQQRKSAWLWLIRIFGVIVPRRLRADWRREWEASTLLFGLTPTDPVSLVLAALAMLCVALVAGYLPSRRATRVDPMVTLRCE